jgi:hypothetical protein
VTDFGPPVPLGRSYAMVTDWRTCVTHFAGCACQQERMRLLEEVARTARDVDRLGGPAGLIARLALKDSLAALAAFDREVAK